MNDLPIATRLWFAFVCLFRVLFDGSFAARAFAVREGMPAPPELPVAALPPEPPPAAPAAPPAPASPAPAVDVETPALMLLAALQREGRLVDFLMDDVASFADAEIGAAARVVHEGCKRALLAHAELSPLRAEAEGASIRVGAGELAGVKLTGDVKGEPPYQGVLVHRGWRVGKLSLPKPAFGFDARIVAPAEVEL